MENRNSRPKLTDTDWIKRVSPERRAHVSEVHKSPSPGRIEVLVESVEEIEVPRKQSKSRKRTETRNEEEDIGLITKVTGKEYIPKGTLELEPMPLLDDFVFSSRHFQALFVEDQRRIKEVRRKQYADKDHDRVRDFVMVKLEAIKSEITAVLNQHFTLHKRAMSKKEIQQAALKLKIEVSLFIKIHEDYRAWWFKNRTIQRSEPGKIGHNLVDSLYERIPEETQASSPSKHFKSYQSSVGLGRTLSKDSKTGESWDQTKDESLEKRSKETEEEAEKKRQELLDLQRQSRRARLMERKDGNQNSSNNNKSKTPQDILPFGMALTERSHKLRKMEKEKKMAETEASQLRKQLEELKKLNDQKERNFSKERLAKSKSRPRQPEEPKPELIKPKNDKDPKDKKEETLLKAIVTLQTHLKDSHQKRSVEKLQRDRTNEKLREELWLAKAEEEGLRRRLQRTEEELEAERIASMQLSEGLMKHSSPDRSSKGESPRGDRFADSDVSFCDKV